MQAIRNSSAGYPGCRVKPVKGHSSVCDPAISDVQAIYIRQNNADTSLFLITQSVAVGAPPAYGLSLKYDNLYRFMRIIHLEKDRVNTNRQFRRDVPVEPANFRLNIPLKYIPS